MEWEARCKRFLPKQDLKLIRSCKVKRRSWEREKASLKAITHYRMNQVETSSVEIAPKWILLHHCVVSGGASIA